MKCAHQTKPLKDVCQFISGLWKGKAPPFVNVGVIRNTNFTKEGTLDDTDIAYLDVEAKKFAARRLQFGDIILEKSGGGPKQPVGRVVLFDKRDGDFSFSNFTAALRVLDPRELGYTFLHKYLHWIYLSGVTKEMQSHSTGIRNLNGDAYKALPISYPPLSEQQRIVGILDKVFEGIATAKANAEKNLQNARALFESHLQAVFAKRGGGWKEACLAALCDIKHGFAFKSEFFVNGGDYILLTPGNFYESGGYRDRGVKQKHYSGPIPDGFILSRGEMLIAMTEQAPGLLGSPLLVPESGAFLHNQRLGLIMKKPGAAWTNEFFFHVFNTHAVRKSLYATASGVKVRHTSPKKIGNIVVAFPASVSEQRRIGVKLAALRTETERLEPVCRRKLAALDELKKSLLHQAFTGQL